VAMHAAASHKRLTEFHQSLNQDICMNLPILLDTTLRDGEQSPGLYFTHDEKVYLAQELDQLGVAIIEAGVPGMGEEEQNVFRKLIHLHLNAEILAWNRLNIDDVRASLKCGVSHIHVSVPTSAILLSKKMQKDASWVFTQMEEVIGYALSENLVVSFGAEDASRTDLVFLSSVFQHAQNLGAVRVRYADTLGIMTPMQTSLAVDYLVQGLDIPLDFHAHNDFGFATANALCAWKSGAQVISCSLLGLGERAGNTALEEFVGAAHFLEQQFAKFDFCRLRELCTALSLLCNRAMPTHKPLFGSDIFKHESGIHVDGLIKDKKTYEFFSPEKVGGQRSLVIGKHSGRAALKYMASLQNVVLTDTRAQQFIGELRQRMSWEKNVQAEMLFNEFLCNLMSEQSMQLEVNHHE